MAASYSSCECTRQMPRPCCSRAASNGAMSPAVWLSSITCAAAASPLLSHPAARHTHARTHACTHTRTHARTCTRTQTRTQTHTRAHIHTQGRAHTRAHTHTCAAAPPLLIPPASCTTGHSPATDTRAHRPASSNIRDQQQLICLTQHGIRHATSNTQTLSKL